APQAHAVIGAHPAAAAARQRAAVGTEDQTAILPGETFKRLEQSSAGQPPEADSMIAAAANQCLAVGSEEDGGDRADVALENSAAPAAGHAPEDGTAVGAPAGEGAAVRAQRQAQDAVEVDVAVPLHGLQDFAVGQPPDLDGAIRAATDQVIAACIDHKTGDAAVMPLESGKRFFIADSP